MKSKFALKLSAIAGGIGRSNRALVLAAALGMGAVIAARERGIEIGRDVSLIGVDGHDVGEVLGLTTMAQPALEQGQVAATMLLDMMTGAPVPEDVVFTSTLVRRTSTAPPSP